MRVIVTGGRGYNGWATVNRVLREVAPTEIAEGGAYGADRMARYWGRLNNVPVRTFPALWNKDGPFAGPMRNTRMLREFRPDMVVAFPGGKGTADMVRKAQGAGVPVKQVSPAPAGEEG